MSAISTSTRALLLALLLAAAPAALRAQAGGGTDAYFRALGEYFDIPGEEVLVLSEWRLPQEEVPVVIFLSKRGGASPDALVALKRGGRSWGELAGRYGLDAAAFHVPLPDGAVGAGLGRAYEQYRQQPAARWRSIQLDDREIVALVNLRFLAEYLDVPPARVVETADRQGSFVAAFRTLARTPQGR